MSKIIRLYAKLPVDSKGQTQNFQYVYLKI